MILHKTLLFSSCLLGLLRRNSILAKEMSGECAANNSSYVSGTHSIAYITIDTEDRAKKLAHGIVSNKLAACVNIVPKILSIYEWEGTVNEEPEVLMMVKTRTSKVDALTNYVKSNHPYTVCEVISIPIINGNDAYLKWISETVPLPDCK
ncbi:hypothetical protein RI129_007306 [Pyrocoelia pectoralis]|uniref:Protein CutA homolog n=1 Tax=Pyrocoelia pectoralis TaxID=417401 RepID=A0AAN7ZMG2_9COLE